MNSVPSVCNPEVTVVLADADGTMKMIYYPASVYLTLKDKLGNHLVFAGRLKTTEVRLVLI